MTALSVEEKCDDETAVNEDSASERICSDEVHKIVGCAFRVYNTLGFGFLEQVYQEALEVELNETGIPFESQKRLPVYYHGKELTAYYKADIVCFENVIVELKAEKNLSPADETQLIHYLKAMGIEAGILINFGNRRKLEWKKLVYTDRRYLKNTKSLNIPSSQ